MRVAELDPRARFALMRNRARMSLPFNACCSMCGDTEPLHLGRNRKRVLCHDCSATKRGRGPIDEHHLGGRPSPTRTIRVSPNLHAELSFLQEAFWRQEHQPGSVYAVAFDAGALWAYQELDEDTPAS